MTAESLRVRMAFLGLISIAIILAITGFGLAALFERHVARRISAELDIYVRQLAADVSIAQDGSMGLSRAPTDPRFSEPYGGLYWQIEQDASGVPLRSRSLWDHIIALPQDELQPGSVHLHRLPGPGGSRLIISERRILYPAGDLNHKLRIAAAADEREIVDAVRAFVGDAAIALVILSGILGLASWLQITIGLRPLAELQEAVASIRAGRRARLDIERPAEVMPLVREVNSLLADRAKAVEVARARAADLAHGLKTPLTVLSGDAERLRLKGEVEIADEIDELATGMQRHIRHELSRARIQSSGRTAEQVLLRLALERLVKTLSRTPQGSRLSWSIEVPERLAVGIREDDLLELLGAILENATKWAATLVKVTAESGKELTVVIDDDGRGVSEEHMALLGDRGVRLDEAKEGTGLGLSIAREIAEKYGGRLQFGKSPFGGLRATTVLPADVALVHH